MRPDYRFGRFVEWLRLTVPHSHIDASMVSPVNIQSVCAPARVGRLGGSGWRRELAEDGVCLFGESLPT